MDEKVKTRARGEDHGRAILTWEKVRGIRNDALTLKLSQRRLAEKWEISQTTIHRIVTNKSWHDPEYTPPFEYRRY